MGLYMKDLLDWAEDAALKNLKSHHETADGLQKQSVTTLTVLLTGATGGLAFAIKGLEQGLAWLAVGSSVFSIYLYILCATLVFNTLRVKRFPSIYNEPENLYQKNYTLQELREAELDNIQKRIEEASSRNRQTASWLNRIRFAALASPVFFALTSFLVVRACPF